MSTRKTLFILATICAVIAACTKENNPATPGAGAILIAGKWQLTAASATVPGSSISVSIFDTIPPCVKDNFYTFATDSTITVDEGATKCDPSDPQTVSGKWSLFSNNTKLKTIDPVTGGDATFNVVSITNTSIIVQDTTSLLGYPINVTVTLTNKK